jgi:hypothetical protein
MASLDAAVSLVPDGCEIEMRRGYRGPYSSAAIRKRHPRLHAVGFSVRSDNQLALALCIAALKARAND